jgi:hypothetical protein
MRQVGLSEDYEVRRSPRTEADHLDFENEEARDFATSKREDLGLKIFA